MSGRVSGRGRRGVWRGVWRVLEDPPDTDPGIPVRRNPPARPVGPGWPVPRSILSSGCWTVVAGDAGHHSRSRGHNGPWAHRPTGLPG